jgi:Xaa-Pro aminopeptidase
MRKLVLLVLLSLTSISRLSAQEIMTREYESRRASLMSAIDSGLVIGFGAPDPLTINPWTQLPAFRYLTGFLEPNAALVLVKRAGKTDGILFTASRDPRRALYEGFPPESAAVARQTGLEVSPLSAFKPTVDSLVSTGLPVYDLRDYATADVAGQDSLTRGARLMADLAAKQPGREPRDAHLLVDSLRARKSPAEMKLLQRAIDITVGSLRQAMAAVKPGMMEYELQAMIEGGFRRAGADGPSFGSIVGSGPNSTQYHYMANNRRLKPGEVVLMDVGAAYQGYAADVTRTVPVSGRFTAEQRAIYQLVRDAQAAAEKVARPGASWRAWNDTARAVEARGLARLGLIESPDATFDPPWADQCGKRPEACRQAFLYMAHGLGHGIGLEVHDAPRRGQVKFEVGQVFTIEPGVYISTKLLDMLPDTPKNRAMIAKVRKTVERYQNIGVRIEDDYLITPNGVEWLSKAPREIAELEALRMVSSARTR